MTATVTKESGARTGGAGSRVLRITASDVYPQTVYAQSELVLEAGKEYQIKGWLRSDPENNFDPYVWISRIDEGGADTVIFTVIGGASTWEDFDETFTPAHDSYLRLGGDQTSEPVENFWFEFDDITLFATEDIPTDPILYWSAGNDAILAKDLVTVFEGEQSLSVTGRAGGDFEPQDVNLDERYASVSDAFVMFDGGNGVIQSRVLDPEPIS